MTKPRPEIASLIATNRRLEERIASLEAALRQKENLGTQGEVFFQTLCRALVDPVLIMYEERFIECNQAAIDALRASNKDEVLGATLHNFSPIHQPDGRPSTEAFMERLAEVRRSGFCRFEWIARQCGGETLSLEIFMAPIIWLAKECLFITWKNISGHKHAEEALRDNQRIFRAIFDNTFQFTGLMKPDGVLIEANKTALEFAGIALEDVRNKPFWMAPWWRHSESIRDHLRDTIARAAKGELVRYETTVCATDGTTKDIDFSVKPVRDDSGKVILLIPEGRDISDRKQAEEILRAEKAFSQTLVEASPAFFVAIGPDGRTLMMNTSMLDALGYQPEEIQGKDYLSTVVVENDRETVAQVFDRLVRSKLPVVCVNRLVTKDGHELLCEWRGRPVFRGEILDFFFGVGIDITEQQKAEDALRRSERQAHAILQQQHQFAGVLAPDGTVVEANRTAMQFAGVCESEVIGRLFWDTPWWTHSTQEQERLKRAVADGRLGKSSAFDTTHIGADGSCHYVEFSLRPVLDDTGVVIYLIAEGYDFTERKMAEERIRESEERFRMLFETANDAIRVMDGEWIVACNAQAFEMFGCASKEELIGKSILDFCPPKQPGGEDSRTKALEFIHAAMAGKPQRFQWMHLRKDGSPLFSEIALNSFTSHGKTYVQSIGRDITARKAAEEALRKSEENFRALTENSYDTIMRFDRELRHVYVNPMVEQQAGIPRDAFIGKNHRDLGFPEELCRLWEDNLARVIDTGHVQRIEFQLPNGLWIDWLCIPEFDECGQVQGVVTSARDITERKRAEVEKEQLQAQLLHAQKMESVGRLAGGVAHDFNNMLNVILGHTELALLETQADNPLYADLQEVRDAALRSADLTRQLLAFARKQVVAPQVLDLNEVVQGMLKMLGRLIGEHIRLVWIPSPKPVYVKIDPAQIDQLLANLCVNARDAIAGNGSVTIQTDLVAFSDIRNFFYMDGVPGDYVRVTITDDGTGMEKEVLDHIFEPFFTTKGIGEGTGLGLATVYGIVKQNNGFVDVSSEPGQGTTFRLYLPKCLENALRTPLEPKTESLRSGNETILLVEDEPMILNMVRKSLKRLKYNIITAASPSEILQWSDDLIGSIDLLITDVVMPDISGKDLYDALLQRSPNLKCLFMSGYTADVIAQHGVMDQGVYFIQKPFKIQELAEIVRQALEHD